MIKATAIYGPPGTGKTTELVRRIQEYVDLGYEPSDIVVVSYTRAAAKEIASRVGYGGIRAQTLHSASYRMAGVVKEQVFDKDWAKQFEKISGIPITFKKDEELEELSEGDAYLALYSYARSTMNDNHSDIFMSSPSVGGLQKYLYFVDTYDSFKEAYGVIDFSDMLDKALGLDPEAKVLILDESQDFSKQQWNLIESWMPYIEHLVLAGDDDQAIYKWSGADAEGMVEFEKKHGAERVVLDQSYRIPKSVHRKAEGLIRQVGSRVEKDYKPRDFEGEIRMYGYCNSVEYDPDVDTLILVRNHALRKPVEEALMSKGIPYRTEGGLPGPLNNIFVKAIRTWVKASANYDMVGDPMLTDSEYNILRRCAQNMYKHLVVENVEKLMDDGITWDRLLYFPGGLGRYYQKLVDKYGSTNIITHIRISTIHNSKGREADRVILINGMTARTAENAATDVDSEIRTFYVGVTRARKELWIVSEENQLRQLS